MDNRWLRDTYTGSDLLVQIEEFLLMIFEAIFPEITFVLLYMYLLGHSIDRRFNA